MKSMPQIRRRASFERLPDGSDYAALPAEAQGLGGGVVRLPAGTTSWQHNHGERELFVVLQGPLSFHGDGGSDVLDTGDSVVVPPLASHRFSADRGDALLFHVYWDDRGDLAAHATAAGVDARDVLIISDASMTAVTRLAAICARRLRQRGGRAEVLSAASVDTVSPPHDGGALEPRRRQLQTALDRACCNAPLQRELAARLAAPLPPTTAADVGAALALLQHELWLAAGAATRVFVFFPLKHASRYALALPLLALDRAQAVPSVLFACEADIGDAIPDWPRWQTWLDALMADLAARDGAIPEAGRWNARQIAALDDLLSLLAVAGNALRPERMDLQAFADGLDAVVTRMQSLAASDPCVGGSESFAAEARTTLALQFAVARRLAHELHAAWPEAAATLAAALGLRGDGAHSIAGALAFIAPGTRPDADALRQWTRSLTS